MVRIYEDFGDFRRFLAAKNKPNQSQLLLAPCTAGGLKSELKKQSQFAPGGMGATSFVKGNYDNKSAGGAEKTNPIKAKLI